RPRHSSPLPQECPPRTAWRWWLSWGNREGCVPPRLLVVHPDKRAGHVPAPDRECPLGIVGLNFYVGPNRYVTHIAVRVDRAALRVRLPHRRIAPFGPRVHVVIPAVVIRIRCERHVLNSGSDDEQVLFAG